MVRALAQNPKARQAASAEPSSRRLFVNAPGDVHEREADRIAEQVMATPAGSPLEPGLREDMEQRFGHDFSRVTVHSGAAAEQSAGDVGASAYTVGNHMVFGKGWFAEQVELETC